MTSPPFFLLQPLPALLPLLLNMSRRSSVVIAEDLHHTRSLSRSSSVASSHLSRWSKPTTTTPTGSRRGSLESHEDGGAARNPLSGHVGHLTPAQEVKLNEFKEELSKRHVYSEGGNREEGGGKGRGRVDDSTLLYVSLHTLFLLFVSFRLAT